MYWADPNSNPTYLAFQVDYRIIAHVNILLYQVKEATYKSEKLLLSGYVFF